jgi:hypothetical protein
LAIGHRPSAIGVVYNESAMRKALIALLVAAGTLAACNSSKPPATATAVGGTASTGGAATGGAVEQKLQEAAGSGATNCGHVRSQAPDQIKPATDCALAAAQKKQAFYVAYDMPGLSVGVAGNSQGKLFSIMAEQAEGQPNANVQAQAEPCPAELRVAGSGRVTCMSPGSAMGTGGSPHGGMPMAMPPAMGENPHGAVGTKPGVANPHAGAEKTPPKK